MITFKLSYDSNDKFVIERYQRQYSLCLRYLYNRIYDNPGISEIELRKTYDSINNKDLISKWLFQCAIKEAKQIYDINKTKKIIFGGRNNFFQYMKGNISKDEYKVNRLHPIYSIGEESKIGNRLFRLQNDMSVLFQPDRHNHYNLKLKGIGNRIKWLIKLIELQNNKQIAITYKLSQSHIYISFNEAKVESHNYSKLVNRTLAIDMNPNYIGYSIVDWKSSSKYNIVDKGCYVLKTYYDKESEMKGLDSSANKRIHLSNKRRYDMIDICKNIVNKAIYYRCDKIGIEDLDIKSKDKGKGKRFNLLCNNKWYRDLFVTNLTKRCTINNIKLIKVKPEYSSFIGNIIFRKEQLFDPILSSIEIGRRAYEYDTQYIEKTKDKTKNIVFPIIDHFNESYDKSMEEFSIKEKQSNWIQLYKQIKEAKIMYRFSLDRCCLKLFRFKSSICYVLI